MINETLVSFKDLFKSKVRNPFFGTLAVVWIFHNWDLVYSLFYFEKSLTRVQKIEFIEAYFNDPGFLSNMMICVLISFAVLIATYLLKLLARLIANVSKDILEPRIQGWTDKNKIYSQDEFDALEENRDLWREKYETEFMARTELLGEYEQLEKLFKQQSTPEESDTEVQKEELPISLSVRNTVKNLNKKNMNQDFRRLIGDINSGKASALDTKYIKQFLEMDLIELKSSDMSGDYFKFTGLGEAVKNYITEHQ